MSRQASSCPGAPGKSRDVPGASSGRLILLFIAAVLLTFSLARNSATAARLFQSPQSPPAQPEQPVQQQQPPAQTQPEQPAQQQPPAQTQPEQPAQEQPPAQTQPEQPAPQAAPAEAPAGAQPGLDPQNSSPDALSPDAQPAGPEASQAAPAPVEEPDRLNRRERSGEADTAFTEEEESSRNFILDRAEFIDSVIVSGAYVWACCGIGLLLLAPVFLLILEIRGRSKRRQNEEP